MAQRDKNRDEKREKNLVDIFKAFDQHRYLYSYALIACYFLLNNTINALSVWTEQTRDGLPAVSIWEPYVWEYTSAISAFALLPFMFFLFKRFPLSFSYISNQVMMHIAASLIFSVLHVILMVLLREGAYSIAGGNYDFGNILAEFWYEYRKDFRGYVFWLLSYTLITLLYRRLKGDASLIKEDEQSTSSANHKENEPAPEFLLVKKLDKEFLVKVSEIAWLESSGNYVNLYKDGRIFPLRATLSLTVKRLRKAGFSQIHRSYAINHLMIESIEYTSSGDGTITLIDGKTLPVSRRYKDSFKQTLSLSGS